MMGPIGGLAPLHRLLDEKLRERQSRTAGPGAAHLQNAIDALGMILGGDPVSQVEGTVNPLSALGALARKTTGQLGPKVFYHGTSNVFDDFKPGRGTREAVFFSPEPKVAGNFSGADAGDPLPGSSMSPQIRPVTLESKKIWDFRKPAHRKVAERGWREWIFRIYPSLTKVPETMVENFNRNLKSGHWEAIEQHHVLDAIKEAGFDAFYVKERGARASKSNPLNVGIFNPADAKSIFVE